jgi:hypothetical protein
MRTWIRIVKRPLPGALPDYFARLLERPAIHAALEAEGIH